MILQVGWAQAEELRVLRDYELDDKYALPDGKVYLSGVQALVRVAVDQRRRDAAAGLHTAGFISGYRGSPLGTYDNALWQAQRHLDEHGIRFTPGINEDLAATAVWGSQQAALWPSARHQGVFGIWYGKGPGVDRSCDALKHGNLAGTSKYGGVLVLAGDDPGAKSSSTAHQSEHALIHCGIPILHPANVQEYLDFGLHAFALSRFSGAWVGFKCVTDTVESAMSVQVAPHRLETLLPADVEPPPGGWHIDWAAKTTAQGLEAVHFEHRIPAVQAYVRANGIDRTMLDSPSRRLGIVTTGKTFLDVRQALDDLGIDERRAGEIGLSLYKVALVWPLEPEGIRRFASGLEEILVVEEKRPVIEEQLSSLLCNQDQRPRIYGKRGRKGEPLIRSVGELSSGEIARVMRLWLGERIPISEPLEEREVASSTLARKPAFCAGCPHNSSTVLPEGSLGQGGIGCHGMSVWLPERNTLSYTHMGGEGANWIGSAPFIETGHIFQNIGDGTFFHSGLLAVRAAVAADVNITYKVLANGAVAMTGGQPVEGESIESSVTVPDIAWQLFAEGVRRIVVVSSDPDRLHRVDLPPRVGVRSRDELDAVQRELREIPGVTALVYDQVCAAEARRLRKRGEFPEPDQRIVINEAVCEGCGDCSVQSNCIAIEPVETDFGRKRRINQSACNKDFSCLRGYCPSFAIVEGAVLRKTVSTSSSASIRPDLSGLPPPEIAEGACNILIAGIGGSGVVTVGALLGMAAHLEDRACSVLDVTGLAQKNGPVTSHVRVAPDADELFASRLPERSAHLVIGCDIVVTAGQDCLQRMSRERTTALVDRRLAPTSDFARQPDMDLSTDGMEASIRTLCRPDGLHVIDASHLATRLMGDALATNLFLVGFAAQRGLLPVGLDALERAIELNGRSVEMNLAALQWGRLAAHDPAAVERAADVGVLTAGESAAAAPEDLVSFLERRASFLSAYQNEAYADRLRRLVDRVRGREAELGLGDALTWAVARSYAKLLAYKDEYEVARLYTDGSFERTLDETFERHGRVVLHLAPQMVFPADSRTGRVRKRRVGPWVLAVFRILARLRFLRGTWLDPFGHTAHRRLERQLIRDFEQTVDALCAGLTEENHALAVEIARLPQSIRGFGVVKDESVATAREKQTDLMDSFHLRAPSAS
jgi:indolepyruvate ferredoxin oxidoreductase